MPALKRLHWFFWPLKMCAPPNLRDLGFTSNLVGPSPRRDGFRMPGDFEWHSGAWMLWPERPDIWREDAQPAQRVFADVATEISLSEPVTVCVSQQQYLKARKALPRNVRVVELSSNDAWMRDVGPTFLTHPTRGIAGINWQFNGYGGTNGGLYSSWELDNLVASKILEIERIPQYQCPVVLEGGAIQSDGDGTLITTEECLLNPNRNPNLEKASIEHLLSNFCSADKVIWIPSGFVDDETDGHIDEICSFIRPSEVALAWTNDPSDPQYERSLAALEILNSETDAKGRRFTVHKIVNPPPLYISRTEADGFANTGRAKVRRAGDRLTASHINYYVGNQIVLLPTFGVKSDLIAEKQLASLFRNKAVKPIFARELVLSGGGIHCVTLPQS